MSESMRVVASGDYLYTMGRETPATMGFHAFTRDAPLLDLHFLPAGAQSGSVAGVDLRASDALLMLGQYLRADAIAAAADRLTVVARAGAGVDKIDVDALTSHGVLLFNVPDALTEGTAAGALALMLAVSRHIVVLDGLTRAGRWDDRQNYYGREMYGKTLGVIGPGRIGGELIRLVAPFRMRTLAFSPRLTRERAAEKGAVAAPLDRLLAESDFIVICCPLTDETRGLLGAREIALIRPDAFLVNVGRGPVIDQVALVAALRARSIAGAALDVFETQPVTADDPLTPLDNVVLSPHHACSTYELSRDVLALTARDLTTVARGGLPESVVNPGVLDSPRFQAKRQALLARLGQAE